MSQFKNKLRESIIAPTITNYKDEDKLVAKVTSSNPNNNKCSIEYLDKNGQVEVNHNVNVRQYTKGMLGWFPEKGDYVIVERIGNLIEIVSLTNTGYYDNKSQIELINDIFSSSIGDGICGNIF